MAWLVWVAPVLACAGPAARLQPKPGALSPEVVPAAVSPPPTDLGVAAAEAPRVKVGIEALPELAMDLAELQFGYDIPLEVNEAVVEYVRMFLSDEYRPRLVGWLSRSHRYVPRFRAILREEGVPEDTVWLAMIESGFVNQATSRAKAAGAWQFIPETGARWGLRQEAWVDERRDPEKSARAAARFLRALHERTGHWYLAWASYNAGPGRIARAMEAGFVDFWEMANTPDLLPRETQTYVPKILAAAILAKHFAAFGLGQEELAPEVSIDYAEVNVARASPLTALAAAAGVTVGELRDLNPELRGATTPPRAYALKIPRAQVALFAARWSPPPERPAQAAVAKRNPPPAKVRGTRPVKHRVQPGDTLWSLSQRHGVTVQQLARWNGIRSPERHTLRSGMLLRVSGVRL